MPKIVKICGLKSTEAAQKAIDSDADLLGFILVPGRARTIDSEVAKKISQTAKDTRKARGRKIQSAHQLAAALNSQRTTSPIQYNETLVSLVVENGPFVVGVFRNQPIDEVFEIAHKLHLDFIQLHGSEDKLQYVQKDHQFGIIARYVVPNDNELLEEHVNYVARENKLLIPLLDSEAGGEGKTIDWDCVGKMDFGRFILAGGLNPDNLGEAAKVENVVGFDVSGGVESNGVKDSDKIEAFVRIGKANQ